MDKLIERINELSRKSREVALTNEEKTEQNELRQQYLKRFKTNLRKQLDDIEIVD